MNSNDNQSAETFAAAASGPNAALAAGAGNRKRLSMSDVSDMLYEFYRTNSAAKAPKQQSVLGAVVAKYTGQTSPTSAETHEPSSIAAIATNGSASATASKNFHKDEVMMMANKSATATTELTQEPASFHPRIKYSLKAKLESDMQPALSVTAIPTSVLVTPAMPTTLPPPTLPTMTTTEAEEPVDVKPIINPTTGLVMVPNPAAVFEPQSVIKPVPAANAQANPQAAAIAAALLRDGYHNFQQHMRAQEIMKFQAGKMKVFPTKPMEANSSSATNILETFLKQQRNSEAENDSDYNDGDDEDDSRYNGFDDIHLMEASKANLPQLLQNAMANSSGAVTPGSLDYLSDESQKYMSLAAQAQAQAFRNLEYSLGDYGNTSPNDSASIGPTSIGPDGEPVYECRHCGKKYRWKSTLRRHENVECGGKEPSHQCPYCPYKSKQRGNLGVHVRKHHAHMPQLTSKRRSKYSLKGEESNLSSANISDDSSSKLIIDCSK